MRADIVDVADSDAVDRILAALDAGEVVVLPSANTYGLIAQGDSDDAILKIFDLKARDRGKPLGYLTNAARAGEVGEVDARARRAMGLWPGPVALIVPKTSAVPRSVTTLETVLLVCPDAFCVALVDRAPFPLVCTSANVSGEPAIVDADVAIEQFGELVACIVDGGGSLHGANSTIWDLTSTPSAVLRQGPYAIEDLRAIDPELELAEERLKR